MINLEWHDKEEIEEGEEEEEGEGDVVKAESSSSTSFSDLTKSMTRASRASQLIGVESIFGIFREIFGLFGSKENV